MLRTILLYIMLVNILTAQPLWIYDKGGGSSPEAEDTCGNAVYLGNGFVLSVAHLLRENPKSGNYFVGAHEDWRGMRKVVPVFWDEHLVLFKVEDLSAWWPRCSVAKSSPVPGEPLRHEFYNWGREMFITRGVIWKYTDYPFSQINERFKQGMSGSGVYNSEGELVGLAEATDGCVTGWNTINEFLEKGANLGVFKEEAKANRRKARGQSRV